MENYNYMQTRSFNLGVAKDTSIEAALVFQELAFWSDKTIREDGWMFKSYNDMKERLLLSEHKVRKAYSLLTEKGYIEVKLMKAYGAPTLHFRILKTLSIHSKKRSETLDSSKPSESIYSREIVKNINIGKAVEKHVEKDHRGKPSPAKEKLREALQSRGIRQLAIITGG